MRRSTTNSIRRLIERPRVRTGLSQTRTAEQQLSCTRRMTPGLPHRRYVHQGVNVRPLHMQNLHSMTEASYIPDQQPQNLPPDHMSLDASQFGYRVVPLSNECRYTSTATTTNTDTMHEYFEFMDPPTAPSSIPESSVHLVNEVMVGTVLDIIESQREWDQLLAEEADHPPHFECWKEDPYLEEMEHSDAHLEYLHFHHDIGRRRDHTTLDDDDDDATT